MKKKILVVIICAAVLCAVLSVLWKNADIFKGTWVNDPDSYTLDFTFMNRTDTARLQLSGGDTLSVQFDMKTGRGDIYITSPDGGRLYTGNDIKSGGFLLDIPADGEYTVTFTARHASGHVDIRKKGA